MNPLWNIEFYQTSSGESPVMVFLQSLPAKDRLKATYAIEVLQMLGINIRMPHARPIEGEKNLFELRSHSGSNIQRIFYFHYTGNTFVLLHGFTKKSQKTPTREIEVAIKRRNAYLFQQEVPHV